MNSSYYAAPDHSLWHGRIDQPLVDATQRWHQRVQMWDLHSVKTNATHSGKAIALLGFCTDEGVKRNHGRIGAKEGPTALRKALANLPVHFAKDVTLFDAGNVVCNNANLENAQNELGQAVAQVLAAGCFPIVLGGGHEVAYGHYLGLKSKIAKSQTFGVLNVDAHFDLRPFENGGHSGSGFLQIAQDCQKAGINFSYFCLGIQKSANSLALFQQANDLGARYIEAQDLNTTAKTINLAKLHAFNEHQSQIYLTICLDAFAAAFAPGVSAPSALGLMPSEILPYLDSVMKSKKVIGLDIAELCPPHDIDGVTAKLAAQFIFHCVNLLW